MNKTGVEFDFVVKDSLQALALYESIFEVERLEVTDLPVGQNEAVFTIYGTRFHLLDENPQFGLEAPAPGAPMSFWFNVMVPSIAHTFQKAINEAARRCSPSQNLRISVSPTPSLWIPLATCGCCIRYTKRLVLKNE